MHQLVQLSLRQFKQFGCYFRKESEVNGTLINNKKFKYMNILHLISKVFKGFHASMVGSKAFLVLIPSPLSPPVLCTSKNVLRITLEVISTYELL